MRYQFGGPASDWYGRFGAALAAGSFDGDAVDDLIIGEPSYKPNNKGAILFTRGGTLGIQPVHAEVQLGQVGTIVNYGQVLGTFRFYSDNRDSLLIGLPLSRLDNSGGPAPTESGFLMRSAFSKLQECEPMNVAP
jgi:hypothetical protein